MVFETTTTLSADDVLTRAKRFFAERVPNTAAFPEKEGPGYLVLRGQGGEEVALAAFPGNGGTRVRGSTLLFDQAVDRFLSTLPEAPSRGIMSGDLPIRVMVLDAWDGIPITLPSTTPVSEVKRRALEAARVTDDPADFLVKFRGAELRDESRTLGDESVPPDGALIVMRRRRIPVR